MASGEEISISFDDPELESFMNSLAGTGVLIRFILRRDRVRLPVWIVSIVGFVVLIAASFPGIYPTEADRQARATFMDSPTAAAFRGPGHGLDDYTFGAMLSMELMGYVVILTALMSIFLVVRHTRAEEESGRLEMIRAAVVGRQASPTAALVVAAGANIAIAVLLAGLLPALGSEYPFAGSLAFGLAVGSAGLVFAAAAAVTVQLSEHGRGASGMAAIVLGVAFVLRAIGDIQDGFLRWLSPIGWAQASRAFVDERWWPMLLATGIAAILVGVAYVLANRRDIAAGLLPQRPGPAQASSLIGHPAGFALRRQLGSLIGWGAGTFILAAAFGMVTTDIDEFLADSPQLEEFLATFAGVTLLDSFLGMLIMLLAMLAAGYAIQSMLRPRGEEADGRAEPVLSTALSRRYWLGSYLIVAMGGAVVILLLAGLGLGATTAIDQSDFSLLPRVLGAALAYIPAVWLLVGLAAALFGFVPRVAGAVWFVLVYGLVVGLFGEQLQLPGWMFNLSPFEHTPRLPAAEPAVLPLVALFGIAATLVVAALAGIRRRDVPSG
jgi:ABC-2 type transport system permease protein